MVVSTNCINSSLRTLWKPHIKPIFRSVLNPRLWWSSLARFTVIMGQGLSCDSPISQLGHFTARLSLCLSCKGTRPNLAIKENDKRDSIKGTIKRWQRGLPDVEVGQLPHRMASQFTSKLGELSTTTVLAFVGFARVHRCVTHNGCVFRCQVNDHILVFWYARLEIWVLTPFDNMINHRAVCPEADWQSWRHPHTSIWFNFSKVQGWEQTPLLRACIGTLCVLFVVI